MKAYIFSIGEPTANLCQWSLERLGFETVVVYNPETTLWQKLNWLYSQVNEDFLRVDADIIVNKNVLKLEPQDNCWWHQSWGYDWYSQELKPLSVNYIKKEAIPYLKKNIGKFEHAERPESQVFRLDEFENPRRCEVYNLMCGLHGYGQNDLDRVFQTKERRKQLDIYDFELAERINQL